MNEKLHTRTKVLFLRTLRPFPFQARIRGVSGAALLLAAASSAAYADQTASDLPTAASPASSQSVGPDQSSISGLPEILVTAQKRTQNIQQTPISVTAISGADLTQTGTSNVLDIARMVPGVAVSRTGPGENNISIRGISSQVGEQSTVGIYLDEVPISSVTQNIDVPLFDLARVEVLRGPQGTLYGSGSMGGTLKYVLNEPDLSQTTFSIGEEAYHIDDSYGISNKAHAVLNVPIVSGVAAIRVLAFGQFDKGYIDRYQIDPNNYLAAAPGLAPTRGVNTERFYGFRAELEYKPWSNVTIMPSYLYQYISQGGMFTIDEPPGNVSSGNFIQTRDVAESRSYVARVANLTAKISLNGWDLVSSTSYFSQDTVPVEDFSKLGYVLVAPPPGDPVVPFVQTSYQEPRELVQELRASGKLSDSFEVVAGAYYARNQNHRRPYAPITPSWVAAYGDPAVFFGTDFNFYNVFYQGDDYDTFSEKAAFGQATYHVTDKLQATVGIRSSWFADSIHGFDRGIFNGPATTYASAASAKGITPRYNVSYNINEDAMVYATAAKGLRAGAAQSPVPVAVCAPYLEQLGISGAPTGYSPDHLWSYELGAKTSALQRRMVIDASVYYIDWTAIQERVELQCGFPFTANFGKAVSKGADIEIQLLPIDSLKLTGTASYTHAELATTTPGTQGVAGNPLVDVPNWSASLSGDYTRTLSSSLNGVLRIDSSYQGTTYRNFNIASPFRIRQPYELTNLRLGVRDGADKWNVSLFADNLFNKFAESGLRPSDTGADLPTTRPVAIIQPRTFGVAMEMRFD